MKPPTTGRPSIFRHKKHHLHGKVSEQGKQAFEQHRVDLEQLAGQPASIGDAIEYLALGPAKIKRRAKKNGGRL